MSVQVIVQREQLREELAAMQRRLVDYTEEMQVKMAQERELARQETRVERTELNAKVKSHWRHKYINNILYVINIITKYNLFHLKCILL